MRDSTLEATLLGNKENAVDGEVRESSGSNRYKRARADSSSGLANYQEKYNKLEENFKKFTQSL